MEQAIRRLLFVALVLVTGCGDEGTDVLPAQFLGEWELAGTSGGLDGEGVPMPEGPRPRIVLTGDNTLEQRGPDGQLSTRRFQVRKANTIFAEEDQWMIVFESAPMELVLQIAEDDMRMSMSENVYDGFSSAYSRVK